MTGPHADQPLVTGGTDLDDADAALVLVHGRGATARSILGMGNEVHREGLALLSPQAAGNSWYPHSFLEPVEKNEPGRSSGLQAVRAAVETALEADVPREAVMLLGFSQGGCLASEFLARNPDRYGGLAVLSGGLIGPEIDGREYEGSLDRTRVFLGCSDVDPHIPAERVHETAAVFERLDATVEKRLYRGMGHGVNQDELDAVDGMVADLLEE